TVWTRDCSSTRSNDHVRVRLIVDRADRRCEPLSRLNRRDRAYVPAFDGSFQKARLRGLERQLIDTGHEEPLARRRHHVAAIRAEVEAIGNLDCVRLLACESDGRVTALRVADILRPGVSRLKGKAARESVLE